MNIFRPLEQEIKPFQRFLLNILVNGQLSHQKYMYPFETALNKFIIHQL